eukprot:scaffold44631_cov66-Phaeocystis_antarctica.AAC.5
MGNVHRIRVVRERPPLLLLGLLARPPQLLSGRPHGRVADPLQLARHVAREARRAEARHHVRARRRAAPPRLRGLLDDAPHQLPQVRHRGLGPAVARLVELVGQRGELVVERVARLLAEVGGGTRPASLLTEEGGGTRPAERRGAAERGEGGRAVGAQVRA